MASNYRSENAFLTQLTSIDTGSREFTNVLTKTLASQEDVNTVMSLRGEDALTIVDILDKALEAPNMSPDLRRRVVRILQRVCCSQTILPRSCTLFDISKEGDIAFSSGGFAEVWKGRHNGKPVRVKAFCADTPEDLPRVKQRLFQEVVIWRRLSHPNVLPVLGVSPEPFPLYVVTEWLPNGDIMDFTSKNPAVNRFRLLAEVASGLRYLHSMGIIHGDLKPANVLISRDGCPRLVDYGFSIHIGAGPGTGAPAEKSDIFAFGTVIHQVLTGRQRSFGVDGTIADDVVTVTRPTRPPDSIEWFSDSVQDTVCKCRSPSWKIRPNLNAVMGVLDEAGDAAELRSRGIKEEDLIHLLKNYKSGNEDIQKAQAQQMVNMLSSVLDDGELHKRKRKRCQKHLRRLCGTFGVLPQSFILEQAFDERETAPFATGGFSDIYKATIDGRPVAIKTLRVTTTEYKKVHKLLAKEVIGWKWLQHDNILPFLGVVLEPPRFSIISERMENGNIMCFIKAHPNHNRLRLLLDAATGLKYLHDHDTIHGDLKGANILVDSTHRARLADFGLATAIDESIPGSSTNHDGVGGTLRWMAPEVLYPNKFGFTRGSKKVLPSRSTDVYAFGMTILEVITGSPPFSCMPASAVTYNVLQGVRPGRPHSGFSNQLWGLLEATWLPEHASQPPKRPQISIIIDQLRKDAGDWNKSIIPQNPRQIAEGADGAAASQSGGMTLSSTDQSSGNDALPRNSYHPFQTNPNQAVQHNTRKSKIAQRMRRFFNLDFFKRPRGFSADL